MTLTPRKYIFRMRGKVWGYHLDLVEAIVDENWEKVISVAKILYHMSGLEQLVEPAWAPLPIPEEEDICCDALEKWGVCQCESFKNIEEEEK